MIMNIFPLERIDTSLYTRLQLTMKTVRQRCKRLFLTFSKDEKMITSSVIISSPIWKP